MIAFFSQGETMKIQCPGGVKAIEIDLLQEAYRLVKLAMLVSKVARPNQQIILQVLAATGIVVALGHG